MEKYHRDDGNRPKAINISSMHLTTDYQRQRSINPYRLDPANGSFLRISLTALTQAPTRACIIERA